MLDGAVEVLMSQPIRPIVLQTPSSACSFGLGQRRHQKTGGSDLVLGPI